MGNVDFTALRENWYSWGLWSGQFLIAWRCQVLGHMHLVFAFAAFYFPIEVWVKKHAHYKMRNVYATWFIAAFYFVDQYHNDIQMLMSCLFFVYSYWFAGKYWKRAPIPWIDFNEKEVDKKTKKKYNLRRSVSLHRYAFPVIARMFASRTQSKPLGNDQPPQMEMYDRASVSRPLSTKFGKTQKNIDQDALVKIIQNAMSSNRSPAQLAAEIVGRVKNGSLARQVPSHPMMELPAESPDLPSFHTKFSGRSGSLPAGFQPPCAFYTRSPSQRNHFHYWRQQSI